MTVAVVRSYTENPVLQRQLMLAKHWVDLVAGYAKTLRKANVNRWEGFLSNLTPGSKLV